MTCPACDRETLRLASYSLSVCAACGCKVPRSRSSRRWTEPVDAATRRRIRSLKRSGHATAVIERLTGVHARTVVRVLRGKTKPGSVSHGLDRLSREYAGVAKRMLSGVTPEVIAAQYGVPVKMVRKSFPEDVLGLPDCRASCGQCVRCRAEMFVEHKGTRAAEHVRGPLESLDDPDEVARRTAEVFASWTADERERRYVGGIGRVELATVSALAIRIRSYVA